MWNRFKGLDWRLARPVHLVMIGFVLVWIGPFIGLANWRYGATSMNVSSPPTTGDPSHSGLQAPP